MSTPDRPHDDRHAADRPRSGVRGVIDDMLGRHDDRPAPDPGAPDAGAPDAGAPRGPQRSGGRPGPEHQDPGNHGPGSPAHVPQGPVDPPRPAGGAAEGRAASAPAGSGGDPAWGGGPPPGDRGQDDRASGTHAADGPAQHAPDRTGADARLGSTAQGTAAHQAGSGMGEDAGGRERLVPAARAQEYGARWDAVKGAFVDEPRQAVRQADVLVGELLDELERLFREQRNGLEQGLDTDAATTEDLRLALRRYRSFFDRLLSL